MPTIDAHAGYATFINGFRCRPADQDAVVRVLKEVVDGVAVGSPGFISASVHRSTDGTRVFNYLQWETAEHLAAMQESDEFRSVARQLLGLIEFEPYECEVVHVAEAG